jgi:stage II sporulation protein D
MRFVGSEGEETLRGNDLRFALGLKSNFITAMKPFLDSSGNLTEMEVRGRGWGHGVGMCQMGAVALAKEGASHQEILKQYYRGIDLNSYQR